MDNRIIGIFQIILIITSVFAFSYLVGENNEGFGGVVVERKITNAEEGVVDGLQKFLKGWMARSKIGIVSAQSQGLWTCPENLNGTVCQEYDSQTCNDNCVTECFPGRRQDFAECKLGTCFDPTEGVCSVSTPRVTCESSGGDWTAAEDGVPPRCDRGCCLLGGEAQFVTSRTCNIISSRVGVLLDGEINRFDPTISNELECLILAAGQEEGACVLNEVPEGGAFNCKFLSQSDCLASGGDFKSGLLCSNPDLNTICLKQESVSCSEDGDELFWFDSCGNRENIYSSNRVQSWNSGVVLSKEESCSVERSNDRTGNQKTCGNCNYLRGSICGSPGSKDEKIVDSALGDFVCKDLSCVDSSGAPRKNGESWCEFDSQIGVVNDGS
jgi:hypothetical protein